MHSLGQCPGLSDSDFVERVYSIYAITTFLFLRLAITICLIRNLALKFRLQRCLAHLQASYTKRTFCMAVFAPERQWIRRPESSLSLSLIFFLPSLSLYHLPLALFPRRPLTQMSAGNPSQH
jgi:hypothetical protein